jgi:hypothetical protein
MYGKQAGNETVNPAAYGDMINPLVIMDAARRAGVATMAIAVNPRDGHQ